MPNPNLTANLWDTWDFPTQEYYLANPDALYRFMFPETSARGAGQANWFQNQYSNLRNKYLTEPQANANQSFYDFLFNTNLPNDFRLATPSQRGENPSLYSPRVTYGGRRF